MIDTSLRSQASIAFRGQNVAKIAALNRSSSSSILRYLRLLWESLHPYRVSSQGFWEKDAARLRDATMRSAEHMTNAVHDSVPHWRSTKDREGDLFQATIHQLSYQRGEDISRLRALLIRAKKTSHLSILPRISDIFVCLRAIFYSKPLAGVIQKIWVDKRIQQLENLKEGKEYLWDGSYYPQRLGKGPVVGHKMAWILRKQKDGRFQLDIVNTGKGLGFHHYAGQERDFKCQTTYEIRNIPRENLVNREFLSKVYRLRSSSEKDPAEYIYKTLLPTLKGEVAPIRDIYKEKKYWVKKQQGGSCGVRWMFPLLKSRLDQKQYDQWKLDARVEDFTYLYGRIRRFPKKFTTLHQIIALEILLKIERQCKKNGFALPSECQTAREKIQAMAKKKKPLENKPQTFSSIIEAISKGYYAEAKEAIEGQTKALPGRWKQKNMLRIGVLHTLLLDCEKMEKTCLTLQARILLAKTVQLIYRELNQNLELQETEKFPGKHLLAKAVENHYAHYA